MSTATRSGDESDGMEIGPPPRSPPPPAPMSDSSDDYGRCHRAFDDKPREVQEQEKFLAMTVSSWTIKRRYRQFEQLNKKVVSIQRNVEW